MLDEARYDFPEFDVCCCVDVRRGGGGGGVCVFDVASMLVAIVYCLLKTNANLIFIAFSEYICIYICIIKIIGVEMCVTLGHLIGFAL